jgi:hypothetical protein
MGNAIAQDSMRQQLIRHVRALTGRLGHSLEHSSINEFRRSRRGRLAALIKWKPCKSPPPFIESITPPEFEGLSLGGRCGEFGSVEPLIQSD